MSVLQGSSAGVKDLADGSLRITIEFDPRFAKDAFALFGARGTPVALAALTQQATIAHAQADVLTQAAKASPKFEPAREPNQLAQKMMIDGYFRNPKLWAAMDSAKIYTQATHKQYIERMECERPTPASCNSNDINCEGDIVLHHVRTAANAGTGIKPAHWYGVPLCNCHHNIAHKHLDRAGNQDLLSIAVKTTAERMKEALKHHLGLASLADITIQQLTAFELAVGV
jgi:hypothetical protein